MKLINKKTRKIVENAYIRESHDFYNKRTIAVFVRDGNHPPERVSTGYETLAELNSEWEDAPEEPEVGYIIDPMEEDCLSVDGSGYEESDVERAKELGMWLETEDEAEKAVEWLKARKVLFDDTKGFKPNWEDGLPMHFAGYDYKTHSLFTGVHFPKVVHPGPYFATHDDAEASIRTHEKEWKIYLLGSDSND